MTIELETALQTAIDTVLQNDAELHAARLAIIDASRIDRTPFFSTWMVEVLTDSGHANESLIGLSKWDIFDVISALGTSVILSATATTPGTKAIGQSCLALFQAEVGRRMPDLKSKGKP